MEWGQRWRWDLFFLDVSLHRGPDEEGKVLEKIGRSHSKMQVPNDGQSPIKSSSCLIGLVSQRRGKTCWLFCPASPMERVLLPQLWLPGQSENGDDLIVMARVLMMDHHWWCWWWWWCITSGWRWSGQEKVGDDLLNISRWQQSFYCSHINLFSVHKLHILIF